MKVAPLSSESTPRLRRALLDHYDRCRRSLPWRGETDPYRILVSEVMLQQTRVETVKQYYGAWLERFPDLASLASAAEDEVLEAWAGLGYYRRARNLHRAARLVRERPEGALPTSYQELRELPGIGEYTAGAVASIAFGEVIPAPDGNVRRVLARLFDVAAPRPAWLRATSATLVDPDRPGDWNQALMELGATVCKARRPECGACPLSEWCAARASGTQSERPVHRPRGRSRSARYAVAVLHEAGRVMLARRPAEALLGGLWAFPEREVSEADAAAEAAVEIAADLGVETGSAPPEALPVQEHRFTHLRATYVPYAIPASVGPVTPPGRVWVEARDPEGVALPAAQRRVLASFVERRRE